MDGLDTGLLLLRLLIGLTLAAHGAQKCFGMFKGGGIAGTGNWLASIGFHPARRQAILAGGTELLGGLALAFGILTPLAAAAIIGVMAVAAVAGHPGKGFFVTRGGWEYCLVLAGAAAAVAFTGPGDLSFDHAAGFAGGGNLWGLFAVTLGVAGAAAQLATRRTEVDLREPDDTSAPSPTIATRESADH
jgi:putative oxidoreductase